MKHFSPVSSYILGFLLSLILTFLAAFLVYNHSNSQQELISSSILTGLLLACALMQLFVQLIFFLHLGSESRPKWNTLFFITTFFGIILIVVGSIWIMAHLNYNMTPTQVNQYIQNQSGF